MGLPPHGEHTRPYNSLVDGKGAESEEQTDKSAEHDSQARRGETSTSGRSETYQVTDALEKIGLGRYQWALLIYAGMAWLSDAMEMMIISLLGPAVACEWDLSARQESVISTVVFAGSLIGANAFGALADTYGRRPGFFATAIFTCIFGLASALAPSFGWLLLFRFFVGMGLGGSHVPLALYMEFAPIGDRAVTLVILQSFWSIGSIVEAAIGWVALTPLGWRWLLAISSVPLLMLALLYPIIPESPLWLAAMGSADAAEAVLATAAKFNKKELPPGRLECRRKPSGQGKGGWASEMRTLWLNIKTTFGKGLALTTGLLIIIWFVNAIIYYSQVLLLTSVQTQGTASSCGEDHRLQLSSSEMRDIFVTAVAELPGLLCAALLIEYIGRKKTMFVALATICLCSGLLVVYPSHPRVLLFLSRAASMGGFTTLIVYTPEVYPTRVRSFALGFLNSNSRLGAIISPAIGVTLAKGGHLRTAEGIITCTALLTAICTLCLPYETKGRSLEEEGEAEPKSRGSGDVGEASNSRNGDMSEHHLLRNQILRDLEGLLPTGSYYLKSRMHAWSERQETYQAFQDLQAAVS